VEAEDADRDGVVDGDRDGPIAVGLVAGDLDLLWRKLDAAVCGVAQDSRAEIIVGARWLEADLAADLGSGFVHVVLELMVHDVRPNRLAADVHGDQESSC